MKNYANKLTSAGLTLYNVGHGNNNIRLFELDELNNLLKWHSSLNSSDDFARMREEILSDLFSDAFWCNTSTAENPLYLPALEDWMGYVIHNQLLELKNDKAYDTQLKMIPVIKINLNSIEIFSSDDVLTSDD